MGYLELRSISKSIGPDLVLDEVTLSVERGQVVGLEGKNGSGKTMAMRVACGLVRPDAGEVVVDGKTLWSEASFPPSVGLLLEAPSLLGGYSAFDNLKLLASIKGIAGADVLGRTLERVGLDPGDRKRVRKYSMGMRQRVGIAMALMESPLLLVLDEPTNALDEKGVQMLEAIIHEERSRGAAVLISSHDAEFLDDVCDRVCHMTGGRLLNKGELHESS